MLDLAVVMGRWFKRLEKLHNTGVKPFADTALRFDVFVVASSLLLLVVGLALPKHVRSHLARLVAR